MKFSFQSAFFEIPDDARHGQHLLCSHNSCRASGVKFRYCYYCKKPVTKQNFRSRHLHSDMDPNTSKGPSLTAAITNKMSSSEDSPKKRSSFTAGNGTMICQTAANESPRPVKQAKLEDTDEASSSVASDDGEPTSLDKVSRRRRWTLLLKERPAEPAKLYAWIRNVEVTSNPNVTFAVPDSPVREGQVEEEGKDAVQESRWITLLEQRSTADMRSNSAFSDWLTQVLQVSCRETLS